MRRSIRRQQEEAEASINANHKMARTMATSQFAFRVFTGTGDVFLWLVLTNDLASSRSALRPDLFSSTRTGRRNCSAPTSRPPRATRGRRVCILAKKNGASRCFLHACVYFRSSAEVEFSPATMDSPVRFALAAIGDYVPLEHGSESTICRESCTFRHALESGRRQVGGTCTKGRVQT